MSFEQIVLEKLDKIDERWNKNDERWNKNDERWNKNDELWEKTEKRFNGLEVRMDRLETKMIKFEENQHYAGIKDEARDDKIQLILEIVQGISEEKVSRPEMQSKFENHEHRICALESTYKSKQKS